MGDLVDFYTETVRIGRTSVTVRVSVEAERWGSAPLPIRRGERVKVTEAEVASWPSTSSGVRFRFVRRLRPHEVGQHARRPPPISFVDALFAGTAPDGGLYMPERLDPLPPGTVEACGRGRRDDRLDDWRASAPGRNHARRTALVRDALGFPIPLVQVTDRSWVLELFHGPTLAFKDVGARVQARLLHHFTDGTPLTILVATSGDTGSAVAQAFHRVPDARVVVLYPEGR